MSSHEKFLTNTKAKRMRLPNDELADFRAYDEARIKVAAELKAGRSTTLAEHRAKRNK